MPVPESSTAGPSMPRHTGNNLMKHRCATCEGLCAMERHTWMRSGTGLWNSRCRFGKRHTLHLEFTRYDTSLSHIDDFRDTCFIHVKYCICLNNFAISRKALEDVVYCRDFKMTNSIPSCPLSYFYKLTLTDTLLIYNII